MHSLMLVLNWPNMIIQPVCHADGQHARLTGRGNEMRHCLALVLTLCQFVTSVRGYVAPIVPNDTFCDFEIIRQAEAGSSSLVIPGSILATLPTARRPYHDGPLLFEGHQTIQWYTPDQACELLSKPPTTFIFVGDSLTRHFMQGMQMLVRGDIKRGAMQEDVPDNVTQSCICDLQFKLKACRAWLLRDTHNVTAQLPCPSARVVYVETSADEHAMAHYKHIASLAAQQQRAVILLGGWGLHNRLLAKPVFKSLIHHTWSLVRNQQNVRVLCLGIHALQENVPEQYKDLFNNKKVTEYNTLMQRLCRASGIPFFDTFAMTLNQTSFDGSHYELRVNVLKAQLLLNVLVDMQW